MPRLSNPSRAQSLFVSLLSAGFADRFVFVLMSVLTAVLFAAGPAAAQDRRQNQPGKFDFYVLSLSWAPTYCDAALDRAPGQAPPAECGERAVPFVVHGL